MSSAACWSSGMLGIAVFGTREGALRTNAAIVAG